MTPSPTIVSDLPTLLALLREREAEHERAQAEAEARLVEELYRERNT